MFYSTDISVTLWILNQNKRGGAYHERMLRNRADEILFMDLRTWNGTVYEKNYVKLSSEQIAAATKIYHDWQTKEIGAKPELYYSAKKGVPSRYIEFVDRDTELDYKAALKTIGAQSTELVERQVENGLTLVKALKKLGC